MINTGWNGQGKQNFIDQHAKVDQCYFDDELDDAETEILPIFKLKVPKALVGLDGSVLDPRSSYDDPAEWEKRARYLGGLFIENFKNSLIQMREKPCIRRATAWLIPTQDSGVLI